MAGDGAEKGANSSVKENGTVTEMGVTEDNSRKTMNNGTNKQEESVTENGLDPAGSVGGNENSVPGTTIVEYAPTNAEDDSTVPFPAEFERYWKAVQDNPLDFTAWTELLQYVEQENHIYAARKAFDAFFARYPYCYGYWKKYADMEKRFDFLAETEQVLQRGLQNIPLSIDLWIHYITYLQQTVDMNLPESIIKIRSVFQSAVTAAGMEFHSDKLWEMFVDWEKEQGELKTVTAIYDRVLSTPTQLYNTHFEKFKIHVMLHPPNEILSTEEFLWLRTKAVAEKAKEGTETEEAAAGDELPPGVETADQETGSLQGGSEMDKIRELLYAIRQEAYNENVIEVSKRWNFEEGIKRPYFHVKPLERAQLKNWRDYLDFEISSGSHNRTIVLFERCVIACALYEEFWLKYAKYLENHTTEGARNVYQRACGYHLPRKPTIHLHWAAFEEGQGNIDEARRILKMFEDYTPGLAVIRLRRVSLERRQGNMEGAEVLLREAIKENEGSPLASFYSIKLARHLQKLQKNLAKARNVLMETIEKDPENTRLYLNLLELEFSADVKQNEGNTLNCIEKVLSSNLSKDIKFTFSQRRLEFLEDFGSNIHSLLTAYDEHQKFLKNYTKKRAAPNGSVEEQEDKKQKVEQSSEEASSIAATTAAATATTTSSSSAMVGDNMASTQAAYNYGTWYQNYASYGYQNPWNYSQYYSQS